MIQEIRRPLLSVERVKAQTSTITNQPASAHHPPINHSPARQSTPIHHPPTPPGQTCSCQPARPAAASQPGLQPRASVLLDRAHSWPHRYTSTLSSRSQASKSLDIGPWDCPPNPIALWPASCQPALGSDAYRSLDIGPWDCPPSPIAFWPDSCQPLASQP